MHKVILHRIWLGVVLLALMAVPTVVQASPRDDAMELAKAASEKAKAGLYEESIALLKQAYELDTTAAVLIYNMARVYEKMGDKKGAKAAYERYILEEKVDQEGIRLAQGYLAALIATMSGQLIVVSQQTGALVLINDKTASLVPMDKPIDMPPGEYEVGLKLCGFSTQRQRVSVRGGELTTVKFVLTAAPGTLVIDCSKASTSVKVDGEPIGSCPLRKEMPVEAGKHQVEFLIEGRPPKVLAFDVAPNQVKTLKFK